MLNTECTDADFEYEGEVNGVKVRSAFQVYRDNAFANTLEEVEEITGVPVDTIASIGREPVSYTHL